VNVRAVVWILVALLGPIPCHGSEAATQALLGGDAACALELFRVRLEEAPDDDRAAAGEIEALLALGRFGDALVRSTGQSEAFDSSPHVLASHGSALLRAGRLIEAESVLAGVEADPHAPARGLIALARLRGARGRHAEAAALAERALELGAHDPLVLFWAAESIGDRDRAMDLLTRFLALEPLGQDDRIEAGIGAKDKPVKLMLDTGSSGLFLVERMARKRGFEFLSEETAFGGGGDKRHRNRRGLFASFRLGELRFGAALAGTTRSEL